MGAAELLSGVGSRAYNIASPNYYSSVWPWLDLMKNSAGAPQQVVGTYTMSSDGWIHGLSAGGSMSFIVCQTMQNEWGYFPPGDYVLKSSSGATLGVTSTGGSASGSVLSNATSAVGRATFTIGALTSGYIKAFTLWVTVKNNTGAAIDITDLVLVLASEEALLTAGEIFKPDYLADLRGAKLLRFMDVGFGNMGAGVNNQATFATLPGQNEAARNMGFPFTCMAKLAKKIGAAMHLNSMTCSKMVNFRYIASTSTFQACSSAATAAWAPSTYYAAGVYRIANGNTYSCTTAGTSASTGAGPTGTGSGIADGTAVWNYSTAVAPAVVTSDQIHYFVNGERLLTASYGTNSMLAPLGFSTRVVYVINANAATGTFQLSLTSGGAAISLSTGSDLYPCDIVYCVISSLDTGPQRVQIHKDIAQAIYNIYPTATIAVGGPNEGWNSAFGQYRYLYSSVSWALTGATGNIYKAHADVHLAAWSAYESVFPPAQIIRVAEGWAANSAAYTSFFSYVDPGYISAGQTMAQILAANLNRSCYSFAPYIVATSATYGQRPTATQVYTEAGNTDAVPDTLFLDYFTRGLATAQAQTQNVVATVRAPGGFVPGLPLITYEYGFDWYVKGDGSSHVVPIGKLLSNWMLSPTGGSGAFYQTAYQTLFAPNAIAIADHYWDAGGTEFDAGAWLCWGLKGGSGAPDSARSAFYKTIVN